MKKLERILKQTYVYGKSGLWFIWFTFYGCWADKSNEEYEKKQRIKKDIELEKTYNELRKTKIKNML